MQLEVSPEVILSQLGYSKSDAALKQAQVMIDNTNQFSKSRGPISEFHNWCVKTETKKKSF